MENNENTALKLSNQAMGAIMMALQESLMNQLDIVPILQNFDLVHTQEGLVVQNPPTVRISNEALISEDDLKNMVQK
tara:strand:- start:556 stop:786 length:231 start_codon:yes stop_codon:yes gene_type:complete